MLDYVKIIIVIRFYCGLIHPLKLKTASLRDFDKNLLDKQLLLRCARN